MYKPNNTNNTKRQQERVAMQVIIAKVKGTEDYIVGTYSITMSEQGVCTDLILLNKQYLTKEMLRPKPLDKLPLVEVSLTSEKELEILKKDKDPIFLPYYYQDGYVWVTTERGNSMKSKLDIMLVALFNIQKAKQFNVYGKNKERIKTPYLVLHVERWKNNMDLREKNKLQEEKTFCEEIVSMSDIGYMPIEDEDVDLLIDNEELIETSSEEEKDLENGTSEVENSTHKVESSASEVENSTFKVESSTLEVENDISEVENSISEVENSTLEVDTMGVKADTVKMKRKKRSNTVIKPQKVEKTKIKELSKTEEGIKTENKEGVTTVTIDTEYEAVIKKKKNTVKLVGVVLPNNETDKVNEKTINVYIQFGDKTISGGKIQEYLNNLSDVSKCYFKTYDKIYIVDKQGSAAGTISFEAVVGEKEYIRGSQDIIVEHNSHYDVEDIVDRVLTKIGDSKEVRIWIKPENNRVYYMRGGSMLTESISI